MYESLVKELTAKDIKINQTSNILSEMRVGRGPKSKTVLIRGLKTTCILWMENAELGLHKNFSQLLL